MADPESGGLDPASEFYESLARQLPEGAQELFRRGVVGPVAERARLMAASARMQSAADAARVVDLPTIEGLLARYRRVDFFLGRHYRILADRGELTEHHLPWVWEDLEIALERIFLDVADIDAHWQQATIRPDRAVADLYVALAEIEGFTWLLDKRVGRVRALTYTRQPGGGAPDALIEVGDDVHLYEIKSLWACREDRVHDLQPDSAGVFQFWGRRGRPRVHDRSIQRNSSVLYRALSDLLTTAADQLNAYAAQRGRPHCPRTVLLVVTQRQPILGVVSTGKTLALQWWRRHPRAITGIEWIAAQQSAVLSLHDL
jgi:hypothetical protein